MNRPQSEETAWVRSLRLHMESKGLNPRSLSLKAGLNPTAVRDMLEGRTRFPRYDTVTALAQALRITPSQLMEGHPPVPAPNSPSFSPEPNEDLELLTEIIARLQEEAEDAGHKLTPRNFAAMVATLYRRCKNAASTPQPLDEESPTGKTISSPQIHDLLAYESLRRKMRG